MSPPARDPCLPFMPCCCSWLQTSTPLTSQPSLPTWKNFHSPLCSSQLLFFSFLAVLKVIWSIFFRPLWRLFLQRIQAPPPWLSCHPRCTAVGLQFTGCCNFTDITKTQLRLQKHRDGWEMILMIVSLERSLSTR